MTNIAHIQCYEQYTLVSVSPTLTDDTKASSNNKIHGIGIYIDKRSNFANAELSGLTVQHCSTLAGEFVFPSQMSEAVSCLLRGGTRDMFF